MATFQLSGAPDGLLPLNVSQTIWRKALEGSVVPVLATTAPIIMGDNSFISVTSEPAAEIVGELANKTESDLTLGAKVIRPIKAHVGLEFSMESVLANPGGVLGLLTDSLSSAIRRQVDLMVLHGRNARTGAAVAGAEYLNQTVNRVELTTTAATTDEVWAAHDLVSASTTLSGWALDPRMVSRMARSTFANGVRQYPSLGMGDTTLTSIDGMRAAVSRTVSGQVDASADTGVRAFGGNWDALKFGYAMGITVERIEYGDPFGNGDLKRRNAIGYRAEAVFGYAILSLDAFVALDDAVA